MPFSLEQRQAIFKAKRAPIVGLIEGAIDRPNVRTGRVTEAGGARIAAAMTPEELSERSRKGWLKRKRRPRKTDVVSSRMPKSEVKRPKTVKQEERDNRRMIEDARVHAIVRGEAERQQANRNRRIDNPNDEIVSSAPNNADLAIRSVDPYSRDVRTAYQEIVGSGKKPNFGLKKTDTVIDILTNERVPIDLRENLARSLLGAALATPVGSFASSEVIARTGMQGFSHTTLFNYLTALFRAAKAKNPEVANAGYFDDGLQNLLSDLVRSLVVLERGKILEHEDAKRRRTFFPDYFMSGAWRNRPRRSLRIESGSRVAPGFDDAVEALIQRSVSMTSGHRRAAIRRFRLDGRTKRTKAERESDRNFIYQSIQEMFSGSEKFDTPEYNEREAEFGSFLFDAVDPEDLPYAMMARVRVMDPKHFYASRRGTTSGETEAERIHLRMALQSLLPPTMKVKIHSRADLRDGYTQDKDGALYDADGNPVMRTVELQDYEHRVFTGLTIPELFSILVETTDISDADAASSIAPSGKEGSLTVTALRMNRTRAKQKISDNLKLLGHIQELEDLRIKEAAREGRRAERERLLADPYERYELSVRNYMTRLKANRSYTRQDIEIADLVVSEARNRLKQEEGGSSDFEALISRATLSRAQLERRSLSLEREALEASIKQTTPHLLSNDQKVIDRRRRAAEKAAEKYSLEIDDLNVLINAIESANDDFARAVDSERKVKRSQLLDQSGLTQQEKDAPDTTVSVITATPAPAELKAKTIVLPSGKKVRVKAYTPESELSEIKSKLMNTITGRNKRVAYVDGSPEDAIDYRGRSQLRRIRDIDLRIAEIEDEFGDALEGSFEPPGFTLADLRSIPVSRATIEIRDTRGSKPGEILRMLPAKEDNIRQRRLITQARERATASAKSKFGVKTSMKTVKGGKTQEVVLGVDELADSMIKISHLRDYLADMESMGVRRSDQRYKSVQKQIRDIESGKSGKALAESLGFSGKGMPTPEEFADRIEEMNSITREEARNNAEVKVRINTQPPLSTRTMTLAERKAAVRRYTQQIRSLRKERKTATPERRTNIDNEIRSINSAIDSHMREIEKPSMERAISQGPGRYKPPTSRQIAAEERKGLRSASKARVAQIDQETKRLSVQRRNTIKRLVEANESLQAAQRKLRYKGKATPEEMDTRAELVARTERQIETLSSLIEQIDSQKSDLLTEKNDLLAGLGMSVNKGYEPEDNPLREYLRFSILGNHTNRQR